KEDELGFLEISRFRERFEEFGEQPEQQRAIERRRAEQLRGIEDINYPASVERGAHEIGYAQRGLSEEGLSPLLLEREERALNGADTGCGNAAVLEVELLAALADVREQGAQIL